MVNNDMELVERALENLRPVPAMDEVRRAQARRAYLAKARSMQQQEKQMVSSWGRWLRQVAAVVAILGAILLATTSTVQAADSAAPGDTLYGIDRAAERVQLQLAGEERQAEIRLALIGERLEEAEHLAAYGNGQNLDQALTAYREAVDEIASVSGNDVEILARMEVMFAQHSERLIAIQAQAPEAAQPGLERALQASQRGHERALEAMENRGRPEDIGPPDDNSPRGNNRNEDSGPPDDEDGDGRPDHAGPPDDRGQRNDQGEQPGDPPEEDDHPGNGNDSSSYDSRDG